MRGHLIVFGGRKKVVFGKLGSLGSSMKKLYHCRHGRMLASSFRASAYLFTPQRIGSQENRWNGIGMGLCHLWPLLLLPQPDTCTPLPPHFLQLFRRGGGSSRLDTTCSVSLALARLLALESRLGLGLRHGSEGGAGVCGGSGHGGVSFHQSAHPQPRRLVSTQYHTLSPLLCCVKLAWNSFS